MKVIDNTIYVFLELPAAKSHRTAPAEILAVRT